MVRKKGAAGSTWSPVWIAVIGVVISILAGMTANLIPTLLPWLNNAVAVGGLLLLATLITVILVRRQSSSQAGDSDEEAVRRDRIPGVVDDTSKSSGSPTVSQHIDRPTGPVVGSISGGEVRFDMESRARDDDPNAKPQE